ncbi:TIR domain-containing protein [Streptosporangium sp. H16]|uniref:tetratricopeptide repeat protein n=1 Tax=Streptosporangium sp. H16 TaxID=3444184 RepID=UPI003F7A86F0
MAGTHHLRRPDGSLFDVFVSVAGPDKPRVRQMIPALKRAGLKVFLDESDIRPFESITERIRQALAGSKALLVCYSRDYPTRSACQWELTAAFLAASHSGSPADRIMVINPETGEDHIAPGELADACFARWPDSAGERKKLAAAIRQRVDLLSGGLGALADRPPPAQWPDGMRGHPGFVGRYRDLWLLHTRLRADDHALTAATRSGGVAVLAGMAGMGKTTLAAEYAAQFGAFYPGGIYWTDASGGGSPHPENVASWYESQLRDLVGRTVPRSRLLPLAGEYLRARPGLSLWIVDEIPTGLPADAVRRLVIPSPSVRTVLITRDTAHSEVAGLVPLGAMDRADAMNLFSLERDLSLERDTVSAGEKEAAGRVIDLLGGHPYAIRMAGRSLRDREGLVSAADLVSRLRTGPPGSTGVGVVLDDTLDRLDIPARHVLDLITVLGPAPVPAELVAAVLGAAAGTSPADAAERAGSALGTLRRFLLATRTGSLWSVHPLVLDATRRRATGDGRALAFEAARQIPVLTATADARGQAHLMSHALALADRRDLPDGLGMPLLRALAAFRLDLGQAAAAAGFLARIATAGAMTTDDLLMSAGARNDSGDHSGALGDALQALDRVRELPGGSVDRLRAHRLAAQALDGLGGYGDADEHWRAVEADSGLAGVSTPEAVAARVARVRSLRLRGRLRDALTLAREIVPARSTARMTDTLLEATLELARLQQMTGAEGEARSTAERVVDAYRERGLTEHVTALAAQEVLAYATVSLQLWELRPNTKGWAEAERRLAELHTRHAASLGPYNTLTLTLAVQRGLTLVRLGRSRAARDFLTPIEADCRAGLGPEHPVTARAGYALGMAHFQLSELDRAAMLLESAFERQLPLLGPVHPETLQSKLDHAAVLLVSGQHARATQMIREVRRDLPREVGRNNDLYGRAVIAEGVLRLPAWMIRGGLRAARWFDRKGGDGEEPG